MFGIGLPEMILILALALIVVGPDKLPDLARSLAKGLMDLKKTAEGLKDSFAEEGNPLDDIRPDLEEAAKSLKQNLLDTPPYQRDDTSKTTGVYPPAENAAMAYKELMKTTDSAPESDPDSVGSVNSPDSADNNAEVSPQVDEPVIKPVADDAENKTPKHKNDL
jgi:sec-independent protein translocase protein TatB